MTGGCDPIDKKHAGGARVTVRLLTPQRNYLEYVAERDEISLSRSLGLIIEGHGLGMRAHGRLPVRKTPINFVINLPHLAILDQLAGQWGLTRSDVARRLIDGALKADPHISG